MKRAVQFLVLLPFTVVLIAVYPLLWSLDWATDYRVIGSLRDEVRELYGR